MQSEAVSETVFLAARTEIPGIPILFSWLTHLVGNRRKCTVSKKGNGPSWIKKDLNISPVEAKIYLEEKQEWPEIIPLTCSFKQ